MIEALFVTVIDFFYSILLHKFEIIFWKGCGAKYKTKPGLVYHIQKAHMKKSTNGHSNGHHNHHTPKVESIPPDENTTNSMYESGVDDMNSTSSVPHTNGSSHKNGHGSRCGICNGNETENRMHQAEKLISCHECQKQFHPTCLNFSQTMLQSVKKYNGQCIECKSNIFHQILIEFSNS